MLDIRLLAAILLALSIGPGVLAEAEASADPEFTAEQLEFFETKVRPVLAESCYSCHSHEAKKLKGGFYLDSRAGFLKAYLAEPGKVEESLFIEAVRYEDPDYAMPPQGKLPDAVIKDLEKWVEMGMPWPAESGPGAGEVFDLDQRRKDHWAWHGPERQGDKTIDDLIAVRLAAEGVDPAPPADKATLIRRVTLDLTGLPPTAEEIDAFVNDPSGDAYEKLVDRLLGSPRYGEKWGRHWLDLVRYAESYGHEFDYNIAHAWKYRDYVIRAFNDDVPYDRFVKEHVAGDLIEPRVHEQTKVNEAVKATGWWFMHEQTHAPTDVRTHESDRVDNQIDVLSKTFMGVTVACARCHDHKFDAISDEDYYSMAGYLQSSRQQEAYLDRGGEIGRRLEKVRAIVAEGDAASGKRGPADAKPIEIEHEASVLFEDFNDGQMSGWSATGWAWGAGPTSAGQWDPTSGDAAVLPGVMHSGLLGDEAVGTLRSPEFDLKYRNVWVLVKGRGEVRLILDSFTMQEFNALLFEGYKTKKIDTKGQWQWVLLNDRRELYYKKEGQHRGYIELIDDLADGHLIVDSVRMGDGQAPPLPVETPTLPKVVPIDPVFESLGERFRQASSNLPKPERVLAITDGSPEDSYLHIRGSWKTKGEDLPRRTLTALGGETDYLPKQGSGRRELAESLIDPTNPLTARVQVNRLWHHLFGRGIVPTVDNLGVLGIPPSNPELLDQLALRFIEDDKWSNKAMIKRIVMSEAYQRSSDKQDAAVEEKDPQNLLLRRQNIRRMAAESIRDSILFVAGSLNEKQFGPPVPLYLTDFMQGRGRPQPGPLDGHGRRSIYTSVRRNFLPPMMLTFDTPVPFSTVGKRNVTNVPAQALTLMNDPFVHDQADKWAKQLVKDGAVSAEARVDAMFRAALGRPPTDTEREAALGYLAQKFTSVGVGEGKQLTDPRPWRDLCHVMFNLKGFTYVR